MSYPCCRVRSVRGTMRGIWSTDLDGFPSQNEERFGALCQEAGELVDQDVFDLVCLLDSNADTDAVDGGLDQDTLVLVAGNGQGVQEDFGRGLSFDLGDIMAFGCLGSEVGQRHGGRQRRPHALQVWSE